ncbi:T-cell immunoglobulin and mucin domain-containing protein 4 [Gadus morhua]|uniref:Ig-like domain-containing protein n=1 Tax=Gadus morhua TaxID=8049 RepID=A0A8C5CW77_GADMO|nr:hepatitis A virus cellular receptor 2 homolog [Gadus morhua]
MEVGRMAISTCAGSLLHWTTFTLLSAPWSPLVSSFKVSEGGVASLSCQYSVKRFGLSRVCWGRSCGTFWCSDILVQTDETGIISKVTDRYRLTGDVLDGQMDLSILNVRRSDSGPYCCRVNINGIFNDKKVVMNLRVVKVPGSITSTTPSTTAMTERVTTAPWASTTTWRNILSSHLELFRRNSTPLHSGAITMEDSVPTLSLQINVPVLSLSLCLLLLVSGTLIVLAFKCGIHRRASMKGCFSTREPPHIIYEIRLRRPIQENIYTLD